MGPYSQNKNCLIHKSNFSFEIAGPDVYIEVYNDMGFLQFWQFDQLNYTLID